MLFSLNDLMSYAVHGKGFTGRVKDIFVDVDTWLIRHLFIDASSWLEAKTAFVSADRISHVDFTERAIKLAISKSDASGPRDIEYERASNSSVLPDMLTGNDAENAAARLAVKADTDGRMFKYSQVKAADATHNGEKIGHVTDILCNQSDLTISHFVIEIGVLGPETQRLLPVEHVLSIDTFDNTAIRVVLHANKAKLEKGPALTHIEEIDRHWLDELAAYYSAF